MCMKHIKIFHCPRLPQNSTCSWPGGESRSSRTNWKESRFKFRDLTMRSFYFAATHQEQERSLCCWKLRLCGQGPLATHWSSKIWKGRYHDVSLLSKGQQPESDAAYAYSAYFAGSPMYSPSCNRMNIFVRQTQLLEPRAFHNFLQCTSSQFLSSTDLCILYIQLKHFGLV